MKFSVPNTLLVTLLALGASTAGAAETVFEFKGSASRNTPEFEVKAPWILDWRITTEGAYESAVDISLEEAGTSAHQGRVLSTKYPGNGVRMFDQDGRFYFRVDSSFSTWTLKVIQLTEEEAEAYTPRERPSAID
ncbi:hypothetical protein F3N42_09050 [Marinihelvus fidelis]|uniref:Uncharacterized protein n=1 Tax=Marinihelvus fidelis TaxID=2613842 RepID=A0A5N0T8W4_9GAMM|nr:hypothetical protein [Marinihelvus fidelis]KAA9131455.1 hypothetical protein F3N42_09050 [Marinihelvus fidelis]